MFPNGIQSPACRLLEALCFMNLFPEQAGEQSADKDSHSRGLRREDEKLTLVETRFDRIDHLAGLYGWT